MKKAIIAILFVILALQTISYAVYGGANQEKNPWKFERPVFRTAFIAIFVLNIVLLLALLILYLNSFMKTKSSFTLGLVFFIGVLLVQRIMLFFFPFIPHLFETLALIILLVLSLE